MKNYELWNFNQIRTFSINWHVIRILLHILYSSTTLTNQDSALLANRHYVYHFLQLIFWSSPFILRM